MMITRLLTRPDVHDPEMPCTCLVFHFLEGNPVVLAGFSAFRSVDSVNCGLPLSAPVVKNPHWLFFR
jgi:hypothetical protein